MEKNHRTKTNDRPIFRPFDHSGEGRVYVRNLPHWRQPGATYFVTFRQDDSIPASVLAEWIDNRDRWYRANGINPSLRYSSPKEFEKSYQAIPVGVRRAFERTEAKMLHEELDKCHGSCVLRRRWPRKTVVDSLHFFHGTRLWMGDFVVMPNHVHAIMIPFDEWELEDLLGSIKKWTSRLIGKRQAGVDGGLDSESQATSNERSQLLDSESQAASNERSQLLDSESQATSNERGQLLDSESQAASNERSQLLDSESQATSNERGQLLDSESQATSSVPNHLLDSESQATSNELAHNKRRFWQFESYDRIIRDKEGLWRFRQYTASNGTNAKLGTSQFTYRAAKWLDEFAACPLALNQTVQKPT